MRLSQLWSPVSVFPPDDSGVSPGVTWHCQCITRHHPSHHSHPPDPGNVANSGPGESPCDVSKQAGRREMSKPWDVIRSRGGNQLREMRVDLTPRVQLQSVPSQIIKLEQKAELSCRGDSIKCSFHQGWGRSSRRCGGKWSFLDKKCWFGIVYPNIWHKHQSRSKLMIFSCIAMLMAGRLWCSYWWWFVYSSKLLRWLRHHQWSRSQSIDLRGNSWSQEQSISRWTFVQDT